MTLRYSFKGRAGRRLAKRVPLSDNRPGFTTIPDGEEWADIEVTVDVDAIVKMYGPIALENKSSTAKQMHGCVKIIATNRKRTAS